MSSLFCFTFLVPRDLHHRKRTLKLWIIILKFFWELGKHKQKQKQKCMLEFKCLSSVCPSLKLSFRVSQSLKYFYFFWIKTYFTVWNKGLFLLVGLWLLRWFVWSEHIQVIFSSNGMKMVSVSHKFLPISRTGRDTQRRAADATNKYIKGKLKVSRKQFYMFCNVTILHFCLKLRQNMKHFNGFE